jgi:hypothetical protein
VLKARFETLRRQHEAEAAGTARKALADPNAYDLATLNDPQRKALIRFWEAWQEELKRLRILDPACGSGAILIEAFNRLHAVYDLSNARLEELRGQRTLFDLDRQILQNNLYGVDLNAEAIQICQLSLWIKTAARGKQLTSLDHTIREGNSVISDPAVQPKAFDWQAAFPELASTAEVEPAAKMRKRRKEGKSSSNEAARTAGLTYLIPCIYQLVSGNTALSPLDEGSQTETTTDRFSIKSAASGQYTETYILDKQSGQVWMMRGQVSKGPYLIPCVYQLSSTRTALSPIDGTSTSAKAGERFSITSVSSGTSAETYVNDIQTGGAWKIRGQVSKPPFLIPCIYQLVSGNIVQTPMERNAEIRLLANKRSQTAPALDSQATPDTPQDPPPQLSPEAQKQLDDKFKKIDERINEDMKKLFPK